MFNRHILFFLSLVITLGTLAQPLLARPSLGPNRWTRNGPRTNAPPRNRPQRPRDRCPDDPTKRRPGRCGCGVPESQYRTWYFDQDQDGYGTPGIWDTHACQKPDRDFGMGIGTLEFVDNADDACPVHPHKIAPSLWYLDQDHDGYGTSVLPEIESCHKPDIDFGMGALVFVDNTDDNCPQDANPEQNDIDDDGLGDACDDNVTSHGDCASRCSNMMAAGELSYAEKFVCGLECISVVEDPHFWSGGYLSLDGGPADNIFWVELLEKKEELGKQNGLVATGQQTYPFEFENVLYIHPHEWEVFYIERLNDLIISIRGFWEHATTWRRSPEEWEAWYQDLGLENTLHPPWDWDRQAIEQALLEEKEALWERLGPPPCTACNPHPPGNHDTENIGRTIPDIQEPPPE